jgi:hypothetical protein
VDYGPVTTTLATEATGTVFTITTFENFIVSYYDPADTSHGGTYNVYWAGPFLPVPPTNTQGWTLAVDQTANRQLLLATVAAGSNSTLTSSATINVNSTTHWPASGLLLIQCTGEPWVAIAYTGLTSTSFTGCTQVAGATYTMFTANQLIVAYRSSVNRRQVYINLEVFGSLAGTADIAQIAAVSTVSGACISAGSTGLLFWQAAVQVILQSTITFPVDPSGYYGVTPITSNGGSLGLTAGIIGGGNWIETDF